MSKSQKYILFSPINEYGGINLEVAFISSVIIKNNHLKIISLGNFYPNSSIFSSNKKLDYNSLNRIIYKRYNFIKLILFVLNLFKPMEIPLHFRLNNKLTKTKLVNLKKIKKNVLHELIAEIDVIILCSQLTSTYIREIIEIGSKLDKKVIFSITGQINKKEIRDEMLVWLKKVNQFIHHSENSLITLIKVIPESQHVIIEQNAHSENKLLQIVPCNKKITKFFTLSRLHKLKQVDKVINAFIKVSSPQDTLTIYGTGPEENNLRNLAKKHSNVIFKGKLDVDDVYTAFQDNDCLVISSRKEAGPYTAVESMAASRPMISTPVGAMKSRLKEYDFFYDGSIKDLILCFNKMKSLELSEVRNLSNHLRSIYLQNHSTVKILSEYDSILEK